MKLLLFSFFLALLVSCAPSYSSTYEVDIHPAFDADHQALLIQAADKWLSTVHDSTQLTLNIKVATCRDDDNTICIFPTDHAGILSKGAHDNPPDIATGRTDNYYPDSYRSRAQIYLDINNLDVGSGFLHNAEHEFGHAFGLVHTGPGTVMCHDTECAAAEVTCADLAQFYQVRRGWETACP